jgi:hypothetical protein
MHAEENAKARLRGDKDKQAGEANYTQRMMFFVTADV